MAAENVIGEHLLEEINAKEDLSLRLGDALDVKASIGLALILFLATQTAYLLGEKSLSLPLLGKWMQFTSIGFVILATFFALYELWPRNYTLPKPESEDVSNRIKELQQHFEACAASTDVEIKVAGKLVEDEIYWAKKRIADNQKKNWRKSNSLNWSFWMTIPAITLNMGTVLTLVLKHWTV